MSENNMASIISYFTILAILIACLGLFGLASFITAQRTKEIGIRKVLGASETEIVRLISREFVILIILANLIAWVPAWYFLDRWLDSFVLHTDLKWWIFVLSGLISFLLALSIVSLQAFRSARLNPVDAIRAE